MWRLGHPGLGLQQLLRVEGSGAGAKGMRGCPLRTRECNSLLLVNMAQRRRGVRIYRLGRDDLLLSLELLWGSKLGRRQLGDLRPWLLLTRHERVVVNRVRSLELVGHRRLQGLSCGKHPGLLTVGSGVELGGCGRAQRLLPPLCMERLADLGHGGDRLLLGSEHSGRNCPVLTELSTLDRGGMKGKGLLLRLLMEARFWQGDRPLLLKTQHGPSGYHLPPLLLLEVYHRRRGKHLLTLQVREAHLQRGQLLLTCLMMAKQRRHLIGARMKSLRGPWLPSAHPVLLLLHGQSLRRAPLHLERVREKIVACEVNRCRI